MNASHLSLISVYSASSEKRTPPTHKTLRSTGWTGASHPGPILLGGLLALLAFGLVPFAWLALPVALVYLARTQLFRRSSSLPVQLSRSHNMLEISHSTDAGTIAQRLDIPVNTVESVELRQLRAVDSEGIPTLMDSLWLTLQNGRAIQLTPPQPSGKRSAQLLELRLNVIRLVQAA